jgi:EAL domain-containing protein (putative c-di-GMP-specific phosphodiesterase class I)
LHLEITENAVMEDDPLIMNVTGELKALEVEICIVDFGSGYSLSGVSDALPGELP